jgi:prephenate dehydratase
MNVAFQGALGAYSEQAAEILLPNATVVPLASFDAVFEAVADGTVERGVIPIENSLFGSVHANYDLLREFPLSIVGELNLRIRHNLLAPEGTTLQAIRRVYSHPQALGQCRPYLRDRLPDAEAIAAYDTAGAARMVAAMGLADTAAIASTRAAEAYGLQILEGGIEGDTQNYTRFLVLARDAEEPPADSDRQMKTSIVYALRENVPGALFKSLGVFALRDIDLFKLESRPLPGHPGHYLFYLDLRGRRKDERIHRALDHLAELASSMKILGTYAAGVFEG